MLFAEHVNYITADGVRLHGFRQIQSELESRASRGLLSKAVIGEESVRVLAPHIAVAICTWRMGTGSSTRAGVMTVVSKKPLMHGRSSYCTTPTNLVDSFYKLSNDAVAFGDVRLTR